MKQTGQKSNGHLIAIIAMFFLFAMIAFVTNLAAPIGTIWGYKFQGNAVLGMMGNMMNFLAYLFMGIPSGKLLLRIGYKKTALWAMILGIIGLFVQWISSQVGDPTTAFIVYLIGAFVCGFCVCMLNTVVNPMLNLLGGGGNKGNQLIQCGGALNSLAGTLTPLFVGVLIGALSPETTISQVTPLLWIAMGIFAAAFIIISFVAIPEPNKSASGKKVKYSHSPWHFRHFIFGVIGIFFYVGIEIGIPGTLNFYLSDPSANGAGIVGEASAIAGAIVALYWLFMLIGRVISGMISGSVSTKTQLTVVCFTALAFLIAAIFISKENTVTISGGLLNATTFGKFSMDATVPVSALLLVLCGFCTSVMWGGIFNLAVEGLGKYTAQASGIFMMMVVGGGVMPLIQQVISNTAGYMNSYWLIVGMVGYLLFYALVGCKNVNTDIPVEEENPNGPDVRDSL